mgnify:CR=1 FL=1
MSTKIKTIDLKSDNAGIQFVESLHHTGFAILYNHPLDHNLITSVYDEWGDFFNSDAKHSYTFNPDTQDGYFPFRSENAKGYMAKDLKEFYHIYQWGKYPENISRKALLLYYEIVAMGQNLLELLDVNSPEEVKSKFSIPLSEMIENSRMNLMRIIHYPPLNSNINDGAIRASAHGDINLITVLPASLESGLQVQTKTGEWIDVGCKPEYLVINSGDMLHECSGGYYPSTIHRVINPKGESAKLPRYTIPVFIHPRDEVILSNKYTAKSFLDERLKEIGLKS